MAVAEQFRWAIDYITRKYGGMTMVVRYETYCGGRLLKVIEQADVSTGADSPAERQYVDCAWTWEVDRREVPQDVATAMLAKYGDTERPGPTEPLIIR